ncbi:MAG: hypothetical protein COA79_19035 [Planctomycetota bacterium]|nr:MAG: hypothetical protein COA79_19035 [Planctomycetota bacterium]
MKKKLCLAFIFISLFSVTLLSKENSLFKSLSGYWEVKGDNMLFHFEKNRMKLFDDSGLKFYRAQYTKNEVWGFTNGGGFPLSIKIIDKNTFELKNEDKKIVFTRRKTLHPNLFYNKIILGKSKLIKTKKKEIQNELAKRIIKDQDVRKDSSKHHLMNRVDKENTKYLIKTIKNIGWIDATRFGKVATNNAFLLVQHSGDISLMKSVLELIKKDVINKKIDGQGYALLYDRYNLYTGKKQKYGTQIGTKADGTPTVFPLENKDKVEAYRKELGIFSLKIYLSFFEKRTNKKAEFIEDVIVDENIKNNSENNKNVTEDKESTKETLDNVFK